MSEYVEFAVADATRFEDLQKVFIQLKTEKDAGSIGGEEQYLALFDEEASGYFVWSTPEEDALYLEKWFATPIETRWTDESLNRGWQFGAMLEAFKNGEYALLSCEMTGPEVARLEFFAHAFPYGGTGCMQALIESFGFKVLIIADGGSPPHPP